MSMVIKYFISDTVSRNYLNSLVGDKKFLINILSEGKRQLFLPDSNAPCMQKEYLEKVFFKQCYTVSKSDIKIAFFGDHYITDV